MEDWPILSPYSVQHKTANSPATSMVTPGVDEHGQEGAQSSEGKGEFATPHSTPILSSPPNCSSTELLVDLSDSSGTVVHAITTPHDEALESPLARKLIIPPRVSSKRSSLPVSCFTAESSLLDVDESETMHQKEIKSGDTKWPVLETQNCGAPDRISRHSGNFVTEHTMKNDAVSTYQDAPKSKAYNQVDSTDKLGMDSISDFDTGSEYSIDEFGTDNDMHSYNRITRLSGHTVNSGLGPILKIANDADNVLLGDKLSASSSIDLEKEPKERQSMTSLADRISRQTLSRLSGGINQRSESSQLMKQDTSSNEIVNYHPTESTSRGKGLSKDVSPKDLSSPLPLPGSHRHSRLPLRHTPGSAHTTPRSVTTPVLHKRTSGLGSQPDSWKDKVSDSLLMIRTSRLTS